MLEEPKRLLPVRLRVGRNPRTSSAPPASHQRERRKESLLLPKLLSSSASSAERSMLRSMLRPADDGEKKAVGGGERLRKHEYEDDSEEEEDRARPELRARSASYGSVFRNRRETPPLRFVREKTGTHVVDQRESVGPQRKLLFDSEFGCFYDPVADRYFSVGHS